MRNYMHSYDKRLKHAQKPGTLLYMPIQKHMSCILRELYTLSAPHPSQKSSWQCSAGNTHAKANQLKTEIQTFSSSTPPRKCSSQGQTTQQCINLPTHSRPALSCRKPNRENYSTTRLHETKLRECATYFYSYCCLWHSAYEFCTA